MKVVFRYRPSKVQLKTVKKLNQDFTPAVSDHFGIYKDSEYITWRYFDKPYNKYTILEVLQDSVSKGYVVLLMKKRSVYVYDIILSTFDSDLLCEVIHSVQNSALEHNLHLVIFRVLNNTFWQQLFKNLGYISKKPSEKSRYYFTVKPHIKSINTTQLFDAEKWLVQNGDIY